MLIIVISLLAGMAIGLAGILPQGFYGKINRMTTVALFILLATMGAQIGSNDELLAQIGYLGWQAVILAVLAILGSVLMLKAVVTVFRLSGERNG